MTRHIALYRSAAAGLFAQGPFPNRGMAAMVASKLAAEERELVVEVAPLMDQVPEVGHAPLAVNADGEGPVPDSEAVRYVCLECGCPAVARPHRQGQNAIDRLAADLAQAQADFADVRRDLREC